LRQPVVRTFLKIKKLQGGHKILSSTVITE